MTVVSNTKLFNVRTSIDYYNPIKDIANTQYYVFAATPGSGLVLNKLSGTVTCNTANNLVATSVDTSYTISNGYFLYQTDAILLGTVSAVNSTFITLTTSATTNLITNSIYYAITSPALMNESVNTVEYNLFEQMIFGKVITPSNLSMMVNRYDWISGTVYAKYDDRDNNLYSKNFFVSSFDGTNYNIFKCIDNASGSPSIHKPLLVETSAADDLYTNPTDGYTWKYMYTVDGTTYNNFTTPSYIPIVANSTVTQFAVNGAVDSITVDVGGNNYVSYATGYFTSVSVGGNTQVLALANGSSSNVGFYTGSALYINSGTGAGQSQPIINYQVTPDQYLVTTQTAFNPLPDFTSNYTIAPNVVILGDGTGAKAISVVNTQSQSISGIKMINRGSGYTYANVNVVGNTGSLVANSAFARAIISPKGGHGANVFSELNSNKVGISVTFSNNENGIISTNNEYSTVGVLKAPLFANVQLTYSAANGAFSPGESIIGYIGSVNTSMDTYTSLLRQYTYNTGNYITIKTNENSVAFSVNTQIYQITPAANGTVISVSANTAVIRQDVGYFVPTGAILALANNLQNNTIYSINSGFTNAVFGLDSANNLFSANSTTTVSVQINGKGILNHTVVPSNTTIQNYTSNSTAIQFYNTTLSNTDVVSISEFITTAMLSNVQHSATGTFVTSNGTVMQLTNVKGQFISNNTILGSLTSATANVTLVSQPTTVFDQTLKLTGQYTTTNQFSLNQYVQQGLPGNGGAFGYLQDIRPTTGYVTCNTASSLVTGTNTKFTDIAAGSKLKVTANSFLIGTVLSVSNDTAITLTSSATANLANVSVTFTEYDFYLTGVKGTFFVGPNDQLQSSDASTFSTVTGLKKPDLVPYTGEIIYAENIVPIARSNNQTETIKLVIQFF